MSEEIPDGASVSAAERLITFMTRFNTLPKDQRDPQILRFQHELGTMAQVMTGIENEAERQKKLREMIRRFGGRNNPDFIQTLGKIGILP